MSFELEKIANNIERIADNVNGGGSGSTSGSGLVIPNYNVTGQTITCNMTYSEIKEAIDARRCVCAITNAGQMFNLLGVQANEIAFDVIQLAPNTIQQIIIMHDINNSIDIEILEKQLPDSGDAGPK